MKKLWNLIIGLMIIIKRNLWTIEDKKIFYWEDVFSFRWIIDQLCGKHCLIIILGLLWLRKEYTACSILKSPHPRSSRNAVTIILWYIKWKQLAYQVTANQHTQLYRCTVSFKPCCFIWIVLNLFFIVSSSNLIFLNPLFNIPPTVCLFLTERAQ